MPTDGEPLLRPAAALVSDRGLYEILVRGFYDGNGDGTGDSGRSHGQARLLQWLGRRLPLLLPFYQSPLRDGGYDISDFWTVLPEYGDLADAVELVEESHKRGIRVIADLVIEPQRRTSTRGS